MRGMFKIYDELESTNDTACLRYMLNSNSKNNTIYLECLLSTRVCLCARNAKSCLPSLASKYSHEPCWFTHEKTSPGMHQDPIDNPSHIASSLSVFGAALSAPRPACATSLQNDLLPAERARIWILSEPPTQTLWLQMTRPQPRELCFIPAAPAGL